MVIDKCEHPQVSWQKKHQATIPEPVRRLLRLKAGDVIGFDMEDEAGYIRKARPVDMAFAESLEGTLTDWASEAE